MQERRGIGGSWDDDLRERLKDPEFKEEYEKELALVELGISIARAREKAGLTQKEVAARASMKQEAISRLENGYNAKIGTLLRVADALGASMKIEFPEKDKKQKSKQQRAAERSA